MDTLETAVDRIFKKLDRAERVIRTISCISEFTSVPEHERLEQVKAALSAYFGNKEGGE